MRTSSTISNTIALIVLISGHIAAAQPQSSPVRDNFDQRLRVIEEKIDVLSRSTEPRTQMLVTPKTVERAIEVLTETKRRLAEDIEKAEQQHAEFRLKN